MTETKLEDAQRLAEIRRRRALLYEQKDGTFPRGGDFLIDIDYLLSLVDETRAELEVADDALEVQVKTIAELRALVDTAAKKDNP